MGSPLHTGDRRCLLYNLIKMYLTIFPPHQRPGHTRLKHNVMADEKCSSAPCAPYTDAGAAPTTITAGNNTAADMVNREEAVADHDEENNLKREEPANPEVQIEALGIPNWRNLEKQVVRRLDMTLMPCLWVLYLFNYLDRASIA